MADLLGFTSIAFVSFITLIIGFRFPDIFKILLLALTIRIFFMLFGHYVAPLPDSTADAETFESVAWSLGQEGIGYVLSEFKGPDPRFISWLIAIPYSLLGRSVLMAQSLSLLFGIGSVFLSWFLAKKIWDDNIAKKVGFLVAIFPSLVLYSVLTMREVYMVFFLLLALYGVFTWVREDSFKSIFISLVGFIGATFFHGALIVGAIIFITIVGSRSIKKSLKSIRYYRINLKLLIFFLIFIISAVYYFSNKIKVPYLGTFENSTNIENLLKKTQVATRGDASWPEWTKINSPIEIIYKAPIRSLYVVFAPFPWDVKKIKHLIGMVDALLYFYLTYLIFKNRHSILEDPALKIFLLILLAYIFVFGIGVGNFGTGIRHRSKFVVIFILLSAPFLKKIVIKK